MSASSKRAGKAVGRVGGARSREGSVGAVSIAAAQQDVGAVVVREWSDLHLSRHRLESCDRH